MGGKEQVLAEHYSHQDNGGVTVKVVASVQRDTQYIDGIPIDGYSVQLALDYDLLGLQSTRTRILVGEKDLLEMGQALIGAVHLLREARRRAERGREDPFRRVRAVVPPAKGDPLEESPAPKDPAKKGLGKRIAKKLAAKKALEEPDELLLGDK